VPASNVYNRRAQWRIRQPRPRALGLGRPPAGEINVAEAGPLLCGGMTVFSPLAMYAKPTSRVGIVGIGGLGHMAVKFAAAYDPVRGDPAHHGAAEHLQLADRSAGGHRNDARIRRSGQHHTAD
jgi:hypothetical protein